MQAESSDAPTAATGSALASPNSRPFARLTYVVGHSRGGTTWLGELLACHQEARYLFEPFASQAHPCTGIDMQTVFNGGRFIRRAKRGAPVADVPVRRFFREPSPGPDLLATLAATHLDVLARGAFPEASGCHLVVKQPRIENLEWAAAAIGADHVIALDRHPFGVVNSVRRWSMLNWTRLDWAILSGDPDLAAADRPLVAAARTPEERLLVLSWLRSRHLRHLATDHPGMIVLDYEALCADPAGTIRRLWRRMGLPPDAGSERALADLLARRSSGGDRWTRFFNVHQDPVERMHAWRHELPASIRGRLERLVRRHDLPIPLPGDGLPDLLGPERLRARAGDVLSIGSHVKRLAETVRPRVRAA